QRAYDLRLRTGVRGLDGAAGKLALARALWAAGKQKDRPRALALAGEALEESKGDAEGKLHQAAEAWLAGKR
ncbi:MAG TPA: hypothetical protein VND93_07660, partial [Myxococcales bacterium]|nr:hypothetical protein [Myxococcales bacterium]